MEGDEKVTILIVDDKKANLYVLQEMLEKPDRLFVSAESGMEALRIALNRDIDLAILDVQMPDMDGFEVAQMLKSHHRTKDIPVIFASAEKKEKQSVMKGFEEGAIDYLSKPLDPEITKAKVNVLLQLQKQKKQIRKLNANLHDSLAQMANLNKELEAFSYSVSHDLRAPLRMILGYSKALEEDYANKLDEDGRSLIRTVHRNANRMNQLIDDLLQFSKLGRREVKKSEVDHESIVRQIIADLRNSAPANIAFEIGTLMPSAADLSLISQVWANLLSNAVKYSSKRQDPVVRIGSMAGEKEIEYFVSDNGAGFDMQYADKLFNVFQRLHAESEFNGTGIGLALVHRIIARHGGKVWGEGKVGEGATFHFSLPVADRTAVVKT